MMKLNRGPTAQGKRAPGGAALVAHPATSLNSCDPDPAWTQTK